MAEIADTRKSEALAKEKSEPMLNLCSIPPGDRLFLNQLLIELGERDWAGDVAAAHQQIIEITKDIAPERLHWVTHRLWLSRLPPQRSGAIT